MTFQTRNETRTVAPGREETIWVLEAPDGRARAEVWPTGGFNCYHWQVARIEGELSLLYAAPDFFTSGRPTRTGIPVLFPFPNRIRDGRFTWDGKQYQLPLNDSSGKNAIHGFACRSAWRVVEVGADEQSAWVTGEFQGSVDAKDTAGLWPADYVLRLTYRLTPDSLRLEALVSNPDQTPLPFGLGYHPYLRIWSGAEARVTAPAGACWELQDGLPTGKRLPLDAARNLNEPRPFESLQLDDVLTDLPATTLPDGLCRRGTVRQPGATVEVLADPAFRDLVVFTPSHREAVALEPYTCVTDAVNLQQRGVDAGWLVLPPQQTWAGVVELRLVSG
jgi:aldose 1-epimerase